jgi:hypothetical protein
MSEENTPEKDKEQQADEIVMPPAEEEVPRGILRIRDEWRAEGLTPVPGKRLAEEEPIVFTETDGQAVGDYTLTIEQVREELGLSHEAMQRLLASGELDSVLVRRGENVERLISESSVARFQADTGLDPAVAERLKLLSNESLAQAVQALREELDQVKQTHGRQLQQMKDVLLLELRNLKEQDRDLTSFVYELAQHLQQVLPKPRKR